VEVEASSGDGLVPRMKVIHLLTGESLKSGFVGANIDVVETDRLDALSIDVRPKIFNITDCPSLDDLCGGAVENYLLTGREGRVRHRVLRDSILHRFMKVAGSVRADSLLSYGTNRFNPS
jgi:hypothetical protein